ncbi:MAG: helix-turn-helix domain-containing protein [Spirochaetaceae bacterium]|jgi:transcriptional regulator with XRE-family HTH domain|nr:helix-turn-helix domain-containing protein [Spirochaetaceae bacterium]
MEFAEKLGISRSAISLIEISKNPLAEQNIKTISLIFGVSEEWLRTGNGDMFKPESFPRYDELLETFRSLSDEMQTLFLDLGRTLLSKSKETRRPRLTSPSYALCFPAGGSSRPY